MFQQHGITDASLKLTMDCNLRCDYCFVHNQIGISKQSMPVEMVRYATEKLFRESPSDIIKLSFMGGEPLFIGKERFTTFCDIITELSATFEKRVNLHVQTNGTLIDQEWIDIFLKYDIYVGISFDGTTHKNYRHTDNQLMLSKIGQTFGAGCRGMVMRTLSTNNIDSLEKDLDELAELKVPIFAFARCVFTEDQKEEEVSPELFRSTISSLCHKKVVTSQIRYYKDTDIACILYRNDDRTTANVYKTQNYGLVHTIFPDGSLCTIPIHNYTQDTVKDTYIFLRDPLEVRQIRSQWKRFLEELKTNSYLNNK